MSEKDRSVLPMLEPPPNLDEKGKGKGWPKRKHEQVIRGPGKLIPVVRAPESLRKKPATERKDIG